MNGSIPLKTTDHSSREVSSEVHNNFLQNIKALLHLTNKVFFLKITEYLID